MMKIIVDDFWYKDQHFDRFEVEIPEFTENVEDYTEKIEDYIIEALDEYLKENN